MGGKGATSEVSKNTVAQRLATIPLQTSAYGVVIPIVYGTNRLTGNLIYYPPSDFITTPHTSTQKSGKGGGGQSTSTTTYTYTACVMIGICEGEIDSIGDVWKDKEKSTTAGFGLTEFHGVASASPWAYLTSNHPTEAIGYGGTALVAASALALGDSSSLPNFSYEVYGLLISAPGTPDSNPADFIQDFLSSTRYGVGWSGYSRIGDLSDYELYCNANGFWLSPVLNEQRAASDWIKEWLVASNSEAVWSVAVEGGGMALKIIPYGDMEVTGNGYTWTPNSSPIYDLGVDDFIVGGPDDDPIEVVRKSIADTYNVVPIQFKDRLLDYNDNTIDDPEQADVDAFGERAKDVTTLNCITKQEVALLISRIQAQRSCYIRNTYKFTLGWKYILLEPMDLVTLTEPLLGLSNKIVRIKSIEEDTEGLLTIEAEEWPFGCGTGTIYTSESGTPGGQPAHNDPPGDIETPLIFDAPVSFREGDTPELVIGAVGLSPVWGGCEVWVSTDNATYAFAGTINSPARIGALTAILATSAVMVDNANTLAVDLSGSNGTLTSTDYDSMIGLLTLSYCDGELLAYQTVTLTGANKYDVTILRRGAHGSIVGLHAIGSTFARLDDAFIHIPISNDRIGQTLYFKFISFNVYGNALQELSDVSPYTHVPVAQMLPQPYNVNLTLM